MGVWGKLSASEGTGKPPLRCCAPTGGFGSSRWEEPYPHPPPLRSGTFPYRALGAGEGFWVRALGLGQCYGGAHIAPLALVCLCSFGALRRGEIGGAKP